MELFPVVHLPQSVDYNVELEAGPSTGTCKQCRGNLVEDASGSMYMLLCEDCGTVDNDESLISGEMEVEDMPDKRGFQPSFGALSEKVEGQYDTSKRRETRFIRIIEQMASDTRLNRGELKMCKEEGRALLKRSERLHCMKRFAAGLVYLAVKRHSPSVTFKEVSQLTHVDQKMLGKVVKWLKKLPSVTVPTQVRTNEQRIQEFLDRLDIPKENEIQAKKIVLDLMHICYGITSQATLIDFTERNEIGTFIVVALNHVYRDKRLPDTSWETCVARILQLKMKTMQTRLGICRHKLISVAAKLPSLELRIQSKDITPRNIDKYLHYILENKDFLLSLSSKPCLTPRSLSEDSVINDDSDSSDSSENYTPNETHLPPIYHPGTRAAHRKRKQNEMKQKELAATLGAKSDEDGDRESFSDGDRESFSELDDKEIDKYIASKNEVRKKRRYLKNQSIH